MEKKDNRTVTQETKDKNFVTGEVVEPSEEQVFRKKVEQVYTKKLIPLGKDKEGKLWRLRYDFSSIAFDPKANTWKVAALWFNPEREDGKTKFTLWKQPEILLYKEKKFSSKMEKWMKKKYKVNFNNIKVSSIIKKIAESTEG